VNPAKTRRGFRLLHLGVAAVVAAVLAYALWPRGGLQPGTKELVFFAWASNRDFRLLKTLIREEFEPRFPGYRVSVLNAPDVNEKLKTMVAGGLPPDVMGLDINTLASYADQGVIRDVQAWFEEDVDAGRLDPSDYYPVGLEALRVNGRLHGLPKGFTPYVIYYNQDLFDRAGLPYPQAGWTWEDLRRAARAITRDEDGDGRTDVFGLGHSHWLQGLAPWIWQNNGRILNEGRTRCVIDRPEAVEALQFLKDLMAEGVAIPDQLSAGIKTGTSTIALFEQGKLAMYGPVGWWMVFYFAKIDPAKVRWDVAPLPVRRPGAAPATAIAETAYCVGTRSPHPRVAWELVKFLSGRTVQRAFMELGVDVPVLRSVAETPAFLERDRPPRSTRVFLDAIEHARVMPTTREFQELDAMAKSRLEKVVVLGTSDAAPACAEVAREINRVMERNRQREARPPPRLDWGWAALILALLAVACVALFLRGRGPRPTPLARREERAFLGLVSPWLVGFLLLFAGPILVSMVLSFSDWSALGPLRDARWIGLDNYREMFTTDPDFLKSLRVTLVYAAVSVPLGLILALVLAVLLDQKVRGMAVYRTVFYLPVIVSGVAVAILWRWLLDDQTGLVNAALRLVGVSNPPGWFMSETWALPAFILLGLWMCGGPMIIFLAGLQSIDERLYEAARIDGAGRFRRFWHITLPGLSAVILFNLIMGVIGSFQVFTQAYIITLGGPNNATLFLVLDIYNQAFRFHRMGYAAAMAGVLFVLVMVLTLAVLRTARHWTHAGEGDAP
jgi:multiple sugar transport system permease protein/multiple sugar transport system substrate-binding protein